jgi:NADH-quinone oxidoreductase subunit M
MPILSSILWLPLTAALLMAVIPSARHRLIRGIAHVATATVLLLILWVLTRFDTTMPTLQFAERLHWNPQPGSDYTLGLDGISLPLLLLSGLSGWLVTLISHTIVHRSKSYHIALLLLEAGLLGVFMTQDWVWFYGCWVVSLLALFFLIRHWGGQARHTASLNFLLYTMGGAVILLIALLAIFTQSTEASSTLSAMTKTAQSLIREQQCGVLCGLCLGFGVLMPVFPLHGWLALALVEAPGPIRLLLSGTVLNLGAYGLLRAIGMLPDAALLFQPGLAGLAIIGMGYATLLAFRQTDLKRLLACFSVSQMGCVLLGIATLNETGLLGASLQMSAHGFVAAALFLAVELLHEPDCTPHLKNFVLLMALAWFGGMALPGTAGFVAELHILLGSLQTFGGLTAAVSLVLLIAAAGAIGTTARLLTGPLRPSRLNLSRRERFVGGVLAAGVILPGLLPEPLIQLMNATVTELGSLFAYRNL